VRRLREYSRRLDRVDESAAHIFGFGFIANFNQAGSCDMHGRFTFQPCGYLLRALAPAFRNAFGQKGSVTHNRQNRNPMTQSFRSSDDLSRHIDDGGIAMRQRSDAVGRNTVMQAMRAPTQSELACGFGFLKCRKIHRVMVFRIRLRDARDDAARKNIARFIGQSIPGQSIPRKPDQRVFTAARRANDKHKRTLFNIGLLQGSMGHGGQETRD